MSHWKELPVYYKVASTFPPWAVEEVKLGFDLWNDSIGSKIFIFDGIKNLGPDQLTGDYTVLENVVLMTQDAGDPDCMNAETSCGPLARVFLRGASAIVDADIYLFQFNLNYVSGRSGTGDRYEISDVILHEAGHILWGAPESTDPTSAVYPILYPVGHPLKRSAPTERDREVVRALYSDDRYFTQSASNLLTIRSSGNGRSKLEYETDSLQIDEPAYR